MSTKPAQDDAASTLHREAEPDQPLRRALDAPGANRSNPSNRSPIRQGWLE